jgi:hypothetical protein
VSFVHLVRVQQSAVGGRQSTADSAVVMTNTDYINCLLLTAYCVLPTAY